MQEEKHIDKNFSKLRHFEQEPPDHVWKGVRKQLDGKSGNRPFLFLLFALLFIGLAGGYFWFANSEANGIATNQSAQKTETEQAVLSSKNTHTPLSENTITETSQTKNTVAEIEKNTEIGATGTASSETQPAEILNAPIYRVGKNRKKVKRGSPMEFLEKKGEEMIPATKEKTILNEQAYFENKETSNAKSLSEAESGREKMTKNHQNLDFLHYTPTPVYTSLVLDAASVRPHIAQFPRTKAAKTTCFDFSEVGTVWAVEGYAGSGYGFRSLTAKNGDLAPWKETRLDTERNRFAWTVGANAMALTRKHFVLRAGVQFTQQNEIYEKEDPLHVRTIIVIDTNIVTGGTTTSTEQQVGFSHVKTYNRLSMIDLPVSIGYEFRKGRKGVSLHAAAALNAYFHRRGEMLDENGDRFRFGNDDGYFKNRLGSSVGGSVQFFYTFSPSARIFAEPYVQHIVRPVNLSTLQQRYTFGGVKVGVAKAIR